MGETKEIQLHRGVKLARIVTAAMAGLFFFIVLAQIVLFPNVQITFNTGADAQQIASISIKKGTEFELPTPLKPGSCFLGWSLTPNGQIIKSSKGFLKNTTLHAVWDGAEKYAVLSVNGIPYKEVNIFDTRIDGLTPAELSENWRILDDYALDNPNRVPFSISGIQSVTVDPNNNFSRFLGWQYLNSYGRYNELRFDADATGMAGDWTLIERDADGNEKYTTITDTNKFYPPNYRTTFTALLEYRTLEIQFYHKGDSTSYKTITVNMGEEVKLPKYENPINPGLPFSHWELQIGDLNHEYVNAEKNPELVNQLSQIKRRYQAGEVISAPNPLWYYFGSELISSDGSSHLVAILEMHAEHWDYDAIPQYTIQKFTDLNSGEEYLDADGIGFTELSLETPVAFEDESIWFYEDDRILSYTFYDHDGNYHELKTTDLINSDAGGISLDKRTSYLGQEIYFNSYWAINIAVNYQSSAENIIVKFNYGTELYSLPNYRFYDKPEVTQYIRKIGNTFVLLTGEKYLKTDHIFTGWRLVGDATERLYCAGESFTIPNFNIAEESNVIEFEAVWHLQRLLFNFDFNGGDWENEQGPDFTLMKGAFGDRVQIVKDIPVRFGYDFVGWTLDSKTYADESELLQPGQVLNVGAKMQTLYAQWQPRRLRIIFYGKEINDAWRQKKRINEDFYTNEQIRAGGYVEMPAIKDTDWSTFNGWVVGDEIIAGYEVLQLTTEVLSQLDTRETADSRGAIMEVRIYADETKNTVDLVYNLDFVVSDNEKFTINVDQSNLQTILVQGTHFFDYYPFSLNQKDLDTNGRQFTGWSYEESGSTERISINESTIVPVGVKKITIYVDFSEAKSFSFQYHDFNGEYFRASDPNNSTNFGGVIPLIYSNDLGTLPKVHDKWGTFVGWALEQDQIAGNPKLIYPADESNPIALKLSNRDDASTDPYLVNIDRHAEQLSGNRYVLKLYAVYATDFAQISYTYLNSDVGQHTTLKFPVYVNGDYTKTVNGGSTVGPDSADFLSYGNAVLDDSTLIQIPGQNFVGWQAELADGVEPTIKADFENKIWFPGEPLPSIDFNINFTPVYVDHKNNVQSRWVGNREYRILSLANANAITINENVDIVALPKGTYTINEGGIKVNSDREVHVIIPSLTDSNITLAPRAIQCDTIKEFYVGENLNISGSPVVGADFQTYRVQKGYRLMDENGITTEIQKPSNKYDYEASLKGLLLSKDRNILYGVPSHVGLTSHELFNYLKEINVQRIKGYALSDLNTLSTINLGFDIDADQEFYIEANAIFNGSASHVILPNYQGSKRIIDASVIAGTLPKLHTVTFGDTITVNSSYAFVDDGFVYYVDNLNLPTAKTHVMYVLPTAKLESLAFTTRNLRFEDTVSKVEPCALMGRDWTQINSIMLENKQIDVRDLVKNIQSDIPVFVSAENQFKASYADSRIQSYVKTFQFICNNSDTVYKEKTIEYRYGETFNVFNAQKNSYEFEFDRTWCQFIGWKVGTDHLLKVGDVYKVGINDIIKGDQYTVCLDASASDCWVNFPVQFYVFDGKNNIPYIPEAFYDGRNNEYEINELLSFQDYLGEIYLPGVDGNFIASDGSHYQFVGWGTSQTNPARLESMLWNKIDDMYRILPNKSIRAGLNAAGSRPGQDNIYRYYALYEKVTPNMQFELLENNTFAVSGLTQANVTSLNIPFAKYHNGYMTPITKINARVFEGISSGAGLTEIAIGGAVMEIEQNAFTSVNAKQINFAHRGRDICYNYKDTPVGKLTIGQEAFARNQVLERLVLPSTLETLHDRAFQACSNLLSVTFDTLQPSLSNLGNFVFRDNKSMTSNEVVRLLMEDNDYTRRFVKVGDGIFMNSGIANLFTADGNPTNKIVWRDKLLHVFYLNMPGFNDLTFNEKEIGGYAFVNAGNNQDVNVKVTLHFSNPNTIIHADAFSYLHTGVNNIYLKTNNNNSIKLDNVDIKAFDDTIKHQVVVYTNNKINWDAKFKDIVSAGYVHFN